MKKLAILATATALVMNLAMAANAAESWQSDWTVYLSLSNGVYNSLTKQYGYAGADVALGISSSSPGTVSGAQFSSISAYVRDMSRVGGGYGLIRNVYDWYPGSIVYGWDNIELFAGASYPADKLMFNVWSSNVGQMRGEYQLRLVVTYAAPGSGFYTGQTLFDKIVDSTKQQPALSCDLSPYKAAYQNSTVERPATILSLMATERSLSLPEPSSVAATLIGLAGFAWFALRRRKQYTH